MVFPPDLLNFVFDLSSHRSHYGRGNHFDYDHAHHVHDLITYIIRRAQAAIVKAAEQLLGNSSSSFPPPSEASSDSWDEFKYNFLILLFLEFLYKYVDFLSSHPSPSGMMKKRTKCFSFGKNPTY